MTPVTPVYYWWYDPALVVGQSYQDPGAGITITTEWVTTSEAAVSVRFSTAVTVAANQPSYTRGQTVSVTARVTSGGEPVANAGVNFAITKSTGAVITASAKTGSNGTAVYKMKL